MLSRYSKLIRAAVLAVALQGSGWLYAGKLDGLLESSPFAPMVQPAPAAKVETESGLELRSVLADGNSFRFSLFDTTTKQSFWVQLNQAGKPALAREYDQAGEVLSVDFNGKQLKVPLKKAKLVAKNVPTVPEAAKGPVSSPLPVAIAPARSTDEVQRMQKITEEVRSRRLARQTGLRPAGGAQQ